MAVEIHLPETPLLAIGKIAWTRQTGEGSYDNGVQFVYVKRIEKRPAEDGSLDALVSRLEGIGIDSVDDLPWPAGD